MSKQKPECGTSAPTIWISATTNLHHPAPKQTFVPRVGIAAIAEIVASAMTSMPHQHRPLYTLPSRKLAVATPLNATTLQTGATSSSVQTVPLTTPAPKNPPRAHLLKASLVMVKAVVVVAVVAAVVAEIALWAMPLLVSSRVVTRVLPDSTAHLHAVNSDVSKVAVIVVAAAIVAARTIAVVSPWAPVARVSVAITAPALRPASPPTALPRHQ
jgi:hypothetical protein